MDVYETLLALKDDPEAFNRKADEIWEQFFKSLSAERAIKLRRIKWSTIDQPLRHIKDPIARCNKSIELMYNSLQTLNLAFNNPDSLIAKSQDGSRAVVLPIKTKM